MKGADKLYSLSCELMALQKECNQVKIERTLLAKQSKELREIVQRQEKLLGEAVQFGENPRKT